MENKLSNDEKDAIKGGIIFVGSTAMGAFDHYPTVFMKPLPGVEVHANAVDNLLTKDFLCPVNPWLVALISVLCIWLIIFLRKFSVPIIAFSTLGVLALFMVSDFYLLSRCYDLGFMTIALSIFIPFIFVSVNKALMEGREKKWIKNTFGQYLSPKVVEVITKDPSKLSLGGEKRDMTAFFLDIAGFTTMSEKMTPEQLTKMLNNYLSGLTDVILKYDGVVDKYIGDCIMAFWNAPLDQKDHRKLACLAAVDCMGEIARLNTELTEFAIKPSARIGLNSGPMVVGNMGSKTRLSYTVMGDSVNLASRLEGANKYFHSKIMVSEYTYEEAKDFIEARRLGQIRVVGKAIPVKVYEPLAHKGKLPAESKKLLEAYNDGLEEFYKGAYDKARKAFEAALAAAPQDGPSRFYLELAEQYSSAVPGGWDGTFNLTSKFHE
jgi:adenylate cyclase